MGRRERIASYTFENFGKRAEITGWKLLIEIIGADAVSRARRWLGIDRFDEPEGPLGGFGSAPGGGTPEIWPDPQPLPD